MSRSGYRRPLSVAGLRMLEQLEKAGGSVATALELVQTTPSRWQVLATLGGRFFVRWDEGGRNVRITEHGRRYLRARRGTR